MKIVNIRKQENGHVKMARLDDDGMLFLVDDVEMVMMQLTPADARTLGSALLKWSSPVDADDDHLVAAAAALNSPN